MANIKVPIGRGIIGQVQQEQFTKEPEKKATNDIEFRRILADQGKLFVNQGSSALSGDVVSVTIPNGSTFYLLKATVSITVNGTSSDYVLSTTIDGIVTTRNNGGGTGFQTIDLTVEGFSIVGNGVNLIRVFNVTGNIDSAATIEGYLEPSATTSSRGSTSAL